MLPIQGPSSASRHRFISLVLLCTVQGVERFAFLAMLPLFVMYANDRHAMSTPTALLVLGVFQALSSLGAWPAGWLTDRKLGARASALLGAALLACGYLGLALDRPALLSPALLVMVAGHSFVKPGLHVLIGNLANNEERTRERTFLWHYLAANVGYIGGALFGEWAHARQGWTLLFGGAAAASAIGVALLAVGMPWLRGGDAAKGSTTSARASSVPPSAGMSTVWLICGVAVVFWLTSQQAGSSLTVFAAMNTALQLTVLGRSFQIGPGHFASLHGLMVLAMIVAFLARKGTQHRAISTAGKMQLGYVALTAAFVLMAAAGLRGGDSEHVSGAWLVGCYALLSMAELLLAPLGVSLITQFAPKDKTAQAVGLWFAGCALGNGLAGALGLCWDRWPHHRYFALLALLSLGAAALLMARRRQLDWLTALSMSAPSQPVVDETRMDTMTTTSNLTTSAPLSKSLMRSPAPSRVSLILASAAILLPSAIAAMTYLPLPVRGVSAIIGGLAVLLCGPWLFSHALVRWTRCGLTDANYS